MHSSRLVVPLRRTITTRYVVVGTGHGGGKLSDHHLFPFTLRPFLSQREARKLSEKVMRQKTAQMSSASVHIFSSFWGPFALCLEDSECGAD